ncbi:MAG: hypothetical protein HOQ13_12655 [Dermatophilaceae bacterium]|nr:hypothetical protein [Dermatophilaceae bacterium]
MASTRSPSPVPHRGLGELMDPELMEDIDLLADVMTSVTGRPVRLTPEEVDAVLGVGSPREAAAHPAPVAGT